MILKGSKIYLQEGIREEDYSLILKGYTDLEVVRYVSFAKDALRLKNVEETKKFISELETGVIFGIYTYDDKFIGYTSLDEFEGKENCEFAIMILDKSYWGKGIGLEVMKIMIGYAFKKLGMKKIFLLTAELHGNAVSLYKKMGFRIIKTIPDDREIYLDGEWIKSGTVEMEIMNSKTKTKF